VIHIAIFVFRLQKKRQEDKLKNIMPVVVLMMALVGCTVPVSQAIEPKLTSTAQMGIPNPASVNCTENGYKNEIRTAPDGSQSGTCVFPDGSNCDEWAYYRGECGPAKEIGTSPTMTVEATKDQIGSGSVEKGSDNQLTPSVTATSTDLGDSDFSGVRVTYIGNSGFMITTTHKKILIDAIYRGIKYVYTLPEDIQNASALALPPFDNIDLILVSHSHRDHFDSSLVKQHLQNDPEAAFAAQERIASQFSGLGNQIIYLDPVQGEPVEVDINGIHVKALSLPHGVNEPGNTGFVITVDGTKLFFSGDLDLGQIDYEVFRAYKLPEEKIDIAFITHYYLTEDKSEQRFVKEGIGAKYLIPNHYYFTDPPMNLAIVLHNYPEAILFTGELSSWEMPE
jgi:L-ascorbate metabolism protein UlaG (beta-lactamase superfamily)/putative hemolysin